MFKKTMLTIISMMIAVGFSVSTHAKSQCSGLAKSVCSVNDTCTWRKASVDKNGKKTKAHCRALPGKSKAKKTTKKTSTKETSTKTSKTKANTTSKSTKTKAKAKAKKKSVGKKSTKAKVKKAKAKKVKKTTNKKTTKS